MRNVLLSCPLFPQFTLFKQNQKKKKIKTYNYLLFVKKKLLLIFNATSNSISINYLLCTVLYSRNSFQSNYCCWNLFFFCIVIIFDLNFHKKITIANNDCKKKENFYIYFHKVFFFFLVCRTTFLHTIFVECDTFFFILTYTYLFAYLKILRKKKLFNKIIEYIL